MKALHLLNLTIFSVQNLQMERETLKVYSAVFSLTAKKMPSVIAKLKLLKFSHAKFTKAKFKYALCDPDIKKENATAHTQRQRRDPGVFDNQ